MTDTATRQPLTIALGATIDRWSPEYGEALRDYASQVLYRVITVDEVRADAAAASSVSRAGELDHASAEAIVELADGRLGVHSGAWQLLDGSELLCAEWNTYASNLTIPAVAALVIESIRAYREASRPA